MKILLQLTVIFIICLCADAISSILPIPFPGSVIAMIILFILLMTKRVKQEQIVEVGDFFLKNMAFFFIPAGVAIIDYFDILKQGIVAFLAVCVITTFITFGVTVWTVKGVMKLQERGNKKHE